MEKFVRALTCLWRNWPNASFFQPLFLVFIEALMEQVYRFAFYFIFTTRVESSLRQLKLLIV